MAKKKCGNRTTHGKYGTPAHRSWSEMKFRCKHSGLINSHLYHDRGIKVCKRWEKFENFLEDMGERPIGTSIDRIDNNKGYSKSNCRWATKKEQCRNKRTNNLVKGKTLSEWSEITGIKRSTLAQRLYVYQWSVDRVLNTPVRGRVYITKNK